MKLEEHSYLGEQEAPMAEETAGKGNGGGGDIETEFPKRAGHCKATVWLGVADSQTCSHKGF